MMRRVMVFFAVVTLLAGLELSTELVTLFTARLGAGTRAIFSGVEFHVAPVRFVVGLISLVVGVVTWGALAWSGRMAAKVNSVGSICPDCGNKTRRVKRKEWHRFLAMLIGRELTRRRCEICGWHGLSQAQ